MKLVIALGGNALGNTPDEQKEAVIHTAQSLADLIAEGHQLLLVHGNGPQVGMIHNSFETAKKPMPFPECTAMSQGYIGYHLQQALINILQKRGLQVPVAAVATQVIVDKKDPAFAAPTKPVGGFYTKDEADGLTAEKGWQMVEDSGRGYRRVVPSPKPVAIVEKTVIERLFHGGAVVIAAGGGGVPVIEEAGKLAGVDAVIDKDHASAALAAMIEADGLIILTAVSRVALRYGKPDQVDLGKVSVQEMERYVNEGHFASGSMLPKVQAGLHFLKTNQKGFVVIGALEEASEAVRGKKGTWIYETEVS